MYFEEKINKAIQVLTESEKQYLHLCQLVQMLGQENIFSTIFTHMLSLKFKINLIFKSKFFQLFFFFLV